MSKQIKYVVVTQKTCQECGIEHTNFLSEEEMVASLKVAILSSTDIVFEVKREMSIETTPAKQVLFEAKEVKEEVPHQPV